MSWDKNRFVYFRNVSWLSRNCQRAAHQIGERESFSLSISAVVLPRYLKFNSLFTIAKETLQLLLKAHLHTLLVP